MKKTRILVLAAVAAAVVVTGPAQAQAAAVPACRNAQITASYHGGDAGMSHTYGRIVLTNTSSTTCSVHGYGGLSYVGRGDGTQVGAAADRDPGTPVRTVVLRPGGRVRSKVAEASYDVFPAGLCKPVAVDGFRVYVPGATASQFVAHPTTGCTVTESHQLSHQAFRH